MTNITDFFIEILSLENRTKKLFGHFVDNYGHLLIFFFTKLSGHLDNTAYVIYVYSDYS